LPADLVEEVARVYGYDRIAVTDMADRLPPQRGNPALEREEAVRDTLVACGLQEIITHSLSNLRQEAALRPGTRVEDLPAETYVVLANPISQDRTVMRHTLLANALEIAAANLRFRDRVQLFEVGKVFLLRPGQELPEERLRLSLALSGSRQDRHWLARKDGEGEGLTFFDLKGIVEALLERLHIAGPAFEPASHPTFQPGRTARLVVQDPGGEPVDLGVLGELHPTVREAFDLPPWRVAAAELDLDALLARVPETWRVAAVSPYPAILQDLAVIVDEDVPAAAVQSSISQAGGFLLQDVQLFDVYRGEPVPAGKKSLAYALTFQAPDKTLRDEIVARQVKAIVRRLEQELGAEMRS
jgi:phenylalanyl-tRNA synthetase beta chain